MQIDLSNLTDSYQQRFPADAEGVYKSGWLLGKARNERDSEQTNLRLSVIDPKVASIFEFYTHPRINFAWENLRSYMVLLTWLAHSHLKENVKRVFDLLVAVSILPLVLPVVFF